MDKDQPEIIPKTNLPDFATRRSEDIKIIRAPLGFFALALLIVEGFLLGAGILYQLSEGMRIAALAVGVVLFLVVVGIVYRLVVKYPRNLVFSEESHVQYAAMKIFGDNTRPITGIEIDLLPPVPAPKPPPQLPSGEHTAQPPSSGGTS